MTTTPTPEQVAAAKREIEAEDEARLKRALDESQSPAVIESNRRAKLPSEHPDHICGMYCDGQDGWTSHCYRLRDKLGFPQMTLDIAEVRTNPRYGFRFAVLSEKHAPHSHSSWYSFDDEQIVRDRWWHPKTGEVVLDVGAAFGSYALPALAMGARVVAFSPADFDTELLKHNLSLNPDLARRCLVVRDGLYSEKGFFDPDGCKFYPVHPDDSGVLGRSNWLMCSTLDRFLAERPGIDRVDWMKLDVEGAELEVLRGGAETIKRYRPRVLVECHEFQVKGIGEQVTAFMAGLGYRVEGPVQHCAVSHALYVPR